MFLLIGNISYNYGNLESCKKLLSQFENVGFALVFPISISTQLFKC